MPAAATIDGNRQTYRHATALYGAPEAAQDEYWGAAETSSTGLGRQSGAVSAAMPHTCR